MSRPTGVAILGHIYRSSALILLNALVLFVGLNLLAAVVLRASDGTSHEPTRRAWLIEKYGFERLQKGYPGWVPEELVAFLFETSKWEHEYEPFTQFRPLPRQDRWITITETGFRPVPDQAPWPPAAERFDVFVFGGSNVLGAGVPDDETIPAHMARLARHCRQPIGIYNFGRGYYFSSQERALFEKLLVEGHRPDLAVFVDGLNDFYYADGLPQWTRDLKAFGNSHFESGGTSDDDGWGAWAPALAALRTLPIVRLGARLRGRWTAGTPPLPASQAPEETEAAARAVIERWAVNRRLVTGAAEAFDVATAFVWQPVPTFGYDLSDHHLWEGDESFFGGHLLSGTGYRLMEQDRPFGPGENVLWLGDLQRGRTDSLYVDAVHYSAAFSAEIAAHIHRFLVERELLPCSGP